MQPIKTSELASRLHNGGAVKLSFHFPNETIFKSLNSLFAKILSKVDLIYLLDTIVTILREIIVNAVKANAKRVFFKKMKLDINNPNEYNIGITDFKNKIIGDLEAIREDLKTEQYRVSIIINKTSDGIKIMVVNNAPILPEEQMRINFRMDKAAQFNDFSDAYEEVYDSTEGAGLGIILVTLLLKNSGISFDSYKIVSDKKNTITSLTIPHQTRPSEITTEIKDHITKEVSGLPTFPKNIIVIQKLCSDPDSSINMISEKISLDPALTSDVLKLSNSAGFITLKRIANINEAIMTIGLKNLNAILIASSSRRILNQRFSKFEQIWSHCNKAAFYARHIALYYRLTQIYENAYLSGLLHDIGKIVLLSTNLKLTNWISDIVKNRKIRTSTVMEEVSIGISHSAIGEMIAKKWHFPEYLIEAIKCHHAPLNTDTNENYKDLVFTTYLANMFCGIESRKYNFYYLEEEVLEKFNITEESSFNKLHDELKSKFNEQSKLS